MREHRGDVVVRSAGELADAIAAARTSSAKIVYLPRTPLTTHFDHFCVGAMAWGDCTLQVEELAAVSTPGRACEWWGRVLRESRHYRLRIYATTQRPQEADKTIFGNFSRCVVFELPNENDRAYVSRALGLNAEARAALDRLQPYQFVEVEQRGKWGVGRLVR